MPITVKSHVGRDVLQNADYFNSIGKVVIEYVTNSLDAGILLTQPVTCEVTIKRNQIIVKDDACGMNYDSLNNNFFTMHGENIYRNRSGVKPRGRFGTGKIAAFGIANSLRVESIKDGLKNVVELTRSELENAKHIGPVPVKEIEVEKPTKHINGTIIRVNDFHTLKRADTRGAITELKRALHKYLEKHFVFVNGERIRYEDPEHSNSFKFDPPASLRKKIGQVELIIKVANAPLEENIRGISITTNGWLVETTLAGLDGKPFTEFLFGDVEIPTLDEENSKVKAFDNTRTLKLNRSNELVSEILNWCKGCLEEVRATIADEYKKQKQTEEMKKLQQEAQKIEEILNTDYEEYRHELTKANPSLGNDSSDFGAENKQKLEGSKYIDGNSVGVIENDIGRMGGGTGGLSNNGGDGNERNPVNGNSKWGSGTESSDVPPNKDEVPSKSKKKHGGFKIDYRHESANANRSRYESDERLIIINLDHPQVQSMKDESGVEGRLFQMITHEIAFTEYALAIVNDLAERGVRVYDAFDALVQCREIIDRVSKRAAAVYSERSTIKL